MKADLRLPVLDLLLDGSYLSFVAKPTLHDEARGKLIAAARAGERPDPARPPTIKLVNLPITTMINFGKVALEARPGHSQGLGV